MRLGHGARLLGTGGRPSPQVMIEGYETAYDEWIRRRREHYPPGQERKAPIAAIVMDVDEARLLLGELELAEAVTPSRDRRLAELVRYLKHFHAELEKHR